MAVYEGKEAYIFISYAHKDAQQVFSILAELEKRDYRYWYDEGITPGSEWPEDVARHLNDAAVMIAFISPHSMASENCRREINFALSKGKEFLSIVLEPTDMPLGMEMQLSSHQSILRYNYATQDAFIEKILQTPCIAACLRTADGNQPPRAEARGPQLSSAERDAALFQIYTKAAELAEKGEYSQELKVLTDGLSIGSDAAMLHVKLGRCYRRLGLSQKALECYEHAKNLNPGEPTIYANIGAVYLLAKQYDAAKTYYEQAVAIMDKDPLAATPGDRASNYGNYALCIGLIGDTKGAKKYLKIARSLGYSEDSIRNICQRVHINPKSLDRKFLW